MSDKKVDEEKKGSQGGMPLAAIGLILGAAVGMALGGPLVAAMGAGVGLVLGAAVDAWRKRGDSS